MNKKFHISAFLIGLAILAIIVIGGHFMIPHILAHSLSKSLGVPVEVGGMNIRYGKVSVSDIAIYNPPHSKLPYAFKVKELSIHAPLREYLQPNINLSEIDVTNNYISVEFYTSNRKESNWTTILNHVNEPTEKTKMKPDVGRTIHIDKLQIQNTAVELMFAGKEAQELPPIKRIVIANINPESGEFTKKLTRILTNHIVSSISSFAGIHGVAGVVLTAPATAVKSIFMPFKFIFGSDKDEKKEDPKESSSTKTKTAN